MQSKKKILAISGSTREFSTNLNLIHAIADLTQSILQIEIYKGLASLPQFNPDLDNENLPPEVAHFRKTLSEADGIFICTPEYAMGVPGSLKNAIDWNVSTTIFSHKPVMLITAATGGEKAHESLLGTLNVIDAKVSSLLVSSAKTKISHDNKITDAATLHQVDQLVSQFVKSL